MNDRATKASLPSITARPTAAEKARFAWLAERAGMSESALALLAIRKFLEPEGRSHPSADGAESVAATDRITIRLRPGDGAAIAKRAAERGMKTSAYLAALARAHVRASPPLPAPEVRKMKEGVEILAGLSHVLARAARGPALSSAEQASLRKTLECTQAVVGALEELMHRFAKAALMAWETRYD